MKKHLVYLAPDLAMEDYCEDAMICYSGDGQSEDYEEGQFNW